VKRNLYAGFLQSGGLSLNLFTDDELDAIHSATLEVLEKTGVFFEDEEAREILAGGGAIVDPETKVVKFPPYLVEDAIRSAPGKVLLAGRDPQHDVVVERNRVGFTNFGEGIMVFDLDSGELRETIKQDVADSAVIVDALDGIDVYERAMGAHDVAQEVQPLHNAEAFLSNTTKHCFHGAGNGRLMRAAIDMAAAIVGGHDKLRQRPIISFNTCPISPLKLVRDCTEVIIEGARAGVMVNILTQALAGGTAPVTLAGTLVVHNAEVLAGITLGQLTRKGTPMMYGSSTCPLDLKTTIASVGAPETGMINAGVANLSNYYGLPSWVAGG
jgi:trimethylamine--corrinoid protein Co-methyltransferase